MRGIALTRTGEKAAPDCVPVYTDVRFHFVIRFGLRPSTHVKMMCGISLLLRKRVFKRRDVYDVPAVLAQIQGRVVAFRLRSAGSMC